MLAGSDMILAEGQYFSTDDYQTKRNNNVLAVGAPGSGKTTSIVVPNLLQANDSYIVSDPKGRLYRQYARYFKSKGYNVKLLDFKQIMQIYKQMMEISNADLASDEKLRTYHITRIALGYGRIYDQIGRASCRERVLSHV